VTDRVFRHQWTSIQQMIVQNTWQIIHLTATLPIVIQETWETTMGVNPTCTIFLRGRTNQLELVYKVQYVNPKEYHLESIAKQLIRILENDNWHEEG